MSAAVAYTVDQSLVDAFMDRVDRFVNNVQNFSDTLKDLLSRSETEPEMEAPVASMYQETATTHSVESAQPEQAVVTADDIDLDALLKGLDLGDGVTL